MTARHILFTVAASIGLLLPAEAAWAQTTQDLKRMSIADILDIRVSTVSRIPEESKTVPAAVYVITHEDIRRSGATSIPEALRLAPGLEVARIDGGTWSVGVRGFADRLARSMLVLIDGRAVYSPLFAGTYWETQDVVLEDVDRIEVIRGPGGTLWGANAVNGIINIVTKAVKETQGLYVTGAAGSEVLGDGAVRYGGTTGATAYRLYAKGEDHGAEFHPDGNDFDGFRGVQAGGRLDWTSHAGRQVTFQGDVYDARLGERPALTLYTAPFSVPTNVDAPLSGGNVLARVNGPASARAPYQLQLYYDRTNRDEMPAGEDRDTFDVDFQQSWTSWPRQRLVWGAGYRVSDGRIIAVAPTSFTPDARTDNLYTGFAQDEITLVPDRVRVTVGSKIEHNDYSGVELQPSARVAWTPASDTTVWASVARAVRTPSRVETDYTTTSLVAAGPTPTFVRLVPDPSFEAENLTAYEIGRAAATVEARVCRGVRLLQRVARYAQHGSADALHRERRRVDAPHPARDVRQRPARGQLRRRADRGRAPDAVLAAQRVRTRTSTSR